MRHRQHRLWLIPKSVPQNLCQACLTFRHPACVVLAYRFFVVSQQVGNIRDGHASLQQNARESVSETVRRRWLIERSGRIESLGKPTTPNIRDRLETLGPSCDER